jgi:XTP/dITP diphosphohydrolase
VDDTILLILATTNADKVCEYRNILTGLPARVQAADEAGLDLDVEETGATFAENALLKARAYGAAAESAGLQAWILADDSGIEVDALDGAPGVYSTRWAGHTDGAGRNRLLLERLAGVPDAARAARFRCVIALRAPDGREFLLDGTVEGRIAQAPTTTPRSGFGYDPIFYLPERGCTMADLPPEEKDAISHRGRAGAAARAILLEELATYHRGTANTE